MKDRKKQRANRKLKHKEEMIDKHNSFGKSSRYLTDFPNTVMSR